MPGPPTTAAATAAPAPASALDHRLVSGIAWTGAAKWATQILSWATTLLLARLLTPADYGLVGMATVVVGFMQLINEFGIGAAIVQRRDLSRQQIAGIGGFAVLVGLSFAALAALGARPIAAFYGESGVAPVLAALGVSFVAMSLRTVPYALLMRDLRWRALAALETGEALVLTLGTLVLAVLGYGHWALVLGVLGSRIFGSVASMLVVRHPIAVPWPFAPIADAVRFGAHVVASRLAWYVYSNADFAIIGRLLGTAALGAYTFGWTLASIPVDKVYQLYQRAAGAVIAKVQDDARAVARYVLRLTEGVALISFPAAVGLALVADQFVPLALGERWLGAIWPLRFLALAAALRSLDPLLAQTLNSIGAARTGARIMLVAAVFMPLLFIAGSRWGVAGVAAAWVVGHPVVVMGQHAGGTLRRIGLSLGDYLRALRPAATSSAVMAVAVLATRAVADPRLPPAAAFAAAVAVGAAAYTATVWLLHGDRVRAFAEVIRSRPR
jgi:PST family polysaccharide transporter